MASALTSVLWSHSIEIGTVLNRLNALRFPCEKPGTFENRGHRCCCKRTLMGCRIWMRFSAHSANVESIKMSRASSHDVSAVTSRAYVNRCSATWPLAHAGGPCAVGSLEAIIKHWLKTFLSCYSAVLPLTAYVLYTLKPYI